MASSGILIADVVEALALPNATVKTYVQFLRENEFIRKSGRGASAAAMNCDDAAALLAAILANPTIVEVVETTRSALSLRVIDRELRFSKTWALAMQEVSKQYFTADEPDDPDFNPTDFVERVISSDEQLVKSLGDMLSRLIACAMSYCEKKGENLVGWENLFEQRAGTDPLRIAFHQPESICLVNLEGVEGLVRRFAFGDPSNPRFTKLPKTVKAIEIALSKSLRSDSRVVGSQALIAIARSLLKPIPPANKKSGKS